MNSSNAFTRSAAPARAPEYEDAIWGWISSKGKVLAYANEKDGLACSRCRPFFRASHAGVSAKKQVFRRFAHLNFAMRFDKSDKTIEDCIGAFGGFIWGILRLFAPSNQAAEELTVEIFSEIRRRANGGGCRDGVEQEFATGDSPREG